MNVNRFFAQVAVLSTLVLAGCAHHPPSGAAGVGAAAAAPPADDRTGTPVTIRQATGLLETADPAPARVAPPPGRWAPAPAPPSPVGSKPPAAPARPLQPVVLHARETTGVTGDFAGYPALDRFLDHMVSAHGFSRGSLEQLFSEVRRKQWTLDFLGRERPAAPPAPGAWSRYRAKFLTERHIAGGAAFWRRYALELQRAEARYGVPPEYVLGILGVETVYGGNLGSHRIIDALSTLAFDYPRRADYFTRELENFLVMARNEGMDPTLPVGSYAGAMGLGQFMPGSFLNWAVDFDGDGRRDLWNPVDAIGSVANYLAAHGWRAQEPVVTPAAASGARAKTLEVGLKTSYPLPVLVREGIRPLPGHAPADDEVRLLRLSTHAGDEYWLGHHNFYVITRYNQSTHYAMAVHQLAQAIKGRHRERVAASGDTAAVPGS